MSTLEKPTENYEASEPAAQAGIFLVPEIEEAPPNIIFEEEPWKSLSLFDESGHFDNTVLAELMRLSQRHSNNIRLQFTGYESKIYVTERFDSKKRGMEKVVHFAHQPGPAGVICDVYRSEELSKEHSRKEEKTRSLGKTVLGWAPYFFRLS